MKLRHLLYFVIPMSMVMSACQSDDETNDDTPPEGALPSVEFTPNNLPEGPYSEDAIRIIANNEYDSPFYSIELTPDGHYVLMQYEPHYMYSNGATSLSVKANNDGSFMMRKKRNTETARTRYTTDDNGTIYLGYGMEYGKFTKLDDTRYLLSNGVEVDLQNISDPEKSISYKNVDGTVSKIYVNVSQPAIMDDATKSLCHTWELNSYEIWAYLNKRYIVHGKQTVNEDGQVETYFKTIYDDLTREDFFDEDYETCYQVVFTAENTYLCFYLDGTAEISKWDWIDKAQGTLHYEDWDRNVDYDENWDGYVTVRFAGSQMRIYEDYTDYEDNNTMRLVGVTTLTVNDN